MSTIPFYYSTDAESYITIPAILSFLDSVKEKPVSTLRPDLLTQLENYSIASDDNKEKVLYWLDGILRQGITELHLFSVHIDMADNLIVSDRGFISKLQSKLNNDNKHFIGQPVSNDFTVIDCSESNGRYGRVFSFSLCKTVYVLPSRQSAYTLLYPAFVDIYLEKSMVVVRGKSKSTMYEYGNGSFNIDTNRAINTDRILFQALEAVRLFSGLGLKNSKAFLNFRSNLYLLLKKYTDTPDEILQLMKHHEDSLNEIAKTIQHDVCGLGEQYAVDIHWDINNLVEKYFSISYPDKSIFTRNRDAYPLHLVAKDDEESKIEQTSGFSEPLQSKAIFFDNKKMMQKTECCEGITFQYQPSTQQKYFKDPFNVTFLAKPSFFMIKFLKYTVEEDIQHVLFSLFNAQQELS